MKVFVGVPCFGSQVYAQFATSFSRLQLDLRDAGIETTGRFDSDPACPRARNEMAARLLESDAEGILFVDADVGFDSASALRLMRSGLDVVGGAYPRKAPVEGYIVDLLDEDVARGKVDLSEHPGGLRAAEVKSIGTGFLWVSRGAFEKVREAYPEIAYTSDQLDATRGKLRWDFFAMGPDPYEPDPAKRRYLSEDYLFCRRWRRLGGKVYADLDSRLTHAGPNVWAGDFKSWLAANLRPAFTNASTSSFPPDPALPRPPNRHERRAMAAKG